MKNAIFMVSDQKYFNYTKACINSIKANYPNHPEIVLVYRYYKIDENELNYLRSLKNVTLKTYFNFNWKLPLNPIGDDIIYQKFFLWDNIYIDDSYDSILHLDCDTLVLKPLDYLFSNNFYIVSNRETLPHINVFGGIRNIYINKKLERFGLTYPEDKYNMVNAGVFVLPKILRTKESKRILTEIAKTFKDYISYSDQSILSLWCQYINKIYSNHIYINNSIPYDNYQTSFSTLNSLNDSNIIENINILHFSGIKPDSEKYLSWNWLKPEFAKYTQELYKKYLDN